MKDLNGRKLVPEEWPPELQDGIRRLIETDEVYRTIYSWKTVRQAIWASLCAALVLLLGILLLAK